MADEETSRLAEELGEILAPLQPVVKPMFGGYCWYIGDVVMGLVNHGAVFIKRSSADHAVRAFAELAPAYPGAKDTWRVPPAVLRDDPQTLLDAVVVVSEARAGT